MTASGPGQFLRRLTQPVAQFDAYFDLFNLISSGTVPHDYAPAISPDGRQVAYVRHVMRQDSRFDGAGIAPLPSQCSVRVVNDDGTGDREVLRMADGLWVTHVSWSPDAKQIAFDLAPQVVLNGWNSLLGDASRSEVYAVNVDGSNPRRLAAAPAAYPSWTVRLPGGPVDPPLPGTPPGLRAVSQGNALELQIDNLVPGRTWRVEGTSALGLGWVTLQEGKATAARATVSLKPSQGPPVRFYRIALP
jgi:hypothetical protein